MMLTTEEHIDEIVREEVVKWIANVWRDQYPDIRYTLNDGLGSDVYAPRREHMTDAGADLRTTCDVNVPAHGSAVISTGVHIELPKGTCGLLVSKSGLNVKFALTSTGLIDEGYTGEILVKLYNDGDYDYFFHAGDKVSQLVIIPVIYPTYVYSNKLDSGERGDAGFGSTGMR